MPRSWYVGTVDMRLILSEDTRPSGAEKKETAMPMFMDVHTLGGPVGLTDVAEAHAADLKVQGAYDVDYMRYWVDEQEGKVFCLVEAPDAETAVRVHQEAHGLLADAIYPVAEGI